MTARERALVGVASREPPVVTTADPLAPPAPLLARLTLALLRKGDLTVARSLGPRRGELGQARRALSCHEAERRFARQVLGERTHLWVLRPSQRAFCGDFLLVDMSARRASERRVIVLELKLGVALKRGGATTHQVQNAAAAVAAAAALTGAIPPDAEYAVWIGDPDQVLAALARRRARRRRRRRSAAPGAARG